jgi:diamine N-acetyltransferase
MEYSPAIFEFYLLHADAALTRCEITVSGEPAGVMALRAPWLSGPFLELLAVFDGFRGQGIGFRLIEWICARHYKSANLWATVSSFNLRAQKFYRNAGFRQIAVLDDLVKEDWDEILVRKRISACR